MALATKILGQGRYNDTNNHDLYTVPTSTEATITNLNIANVTASAITARVFVVPPTKTAVASTAIVWDFTIPGNDYHRLIENGKLMLETSAKITVQNGTANSLTFTLSGIEKT